jgi:hypothetical protein
MLALLKTKLMAYSASLTLIMVKIESSEKTAEEVEAAEVVVVAEVATEVAVIAEAEEKAETEVVTDHKEEEEAVSLYITTRPSPHSATSERTPLAVK